MTDLTRRAVVRLTHPEIVRALDLPDDLQVTGVHADFLSLSILVTVQGSGLEFVAPGALPPELDREQLHRHRHDWQPYTDTARFEVCAAAGCGVGRPKL